MKTARRTKAVMPTAMPATSVRGALLDCEAIAPAGLLGKGRLDGRTVDEATFTDSVAVTVTFTERLTFSVLDGVSLSYVGVIVVVVGEEVLSPLTVLETSVGEELLSTLTVLETSVGVVNDPVEVSVSEMVKVELELSLLVLVIVLPGANGPPKGGMGEVEIIPGPRGSIVVLLLGKCTRSQLPGVPCPTQLDLKETPG